MMALQSFNQRYNRILQLFDSVSGKILCHMFYNLLCHNILGAERGAQSVPGWYQDSFCCRPLFYIASPDYEKYPRSNQCRIQICSDKASPSSKHSLIHVNCALRTTDTKKNLILAHMPTLSIINREQTYRCTHKVNCVKRQAPQMIKTALQVFQNNIYL